MKKIHLSDKIHEECGVFGMYAPSGENVGSDIYNGLTALQHRGQEAAGISVSETDGPGGNIRTKKGMKVKQQKHIQLRKLCGGGEKP